MWRPSNRVKIALQPACRLTATARLRNATGRRPDDRHNWKKSAGGGQNFNFFLKLQRRPSGVWNAACRLCLPPSCHRPILSENWHLPRGQAVFTNLWPYYKSLSSKQFADSRSIPIQVEVEFQSTLRAVRGAVLCNSEIMGYAGPSAQISQTDSRARIHQPFSRTFFVFVSKICKFECNTTSDWLNRTV